MMLKKIICYALLIQTTLSLSVEPIKVQNIHYPQQTATNALIYATTAIAIASPIYYFLDKIINNALINTPSATPKNIFTVYQPGNIKENFSNIAGNHDAKESLEDIINYLKNPEPFQKIGARPPKGILFTGEPGTGKTLLAKGLAGELSNCSFISCTGSEFAGKYIGDGVTHVKELFKTAREFAPCIIFIDEIDSLASKRKPDGDSYSQESAQTVNALLTEMDGFNLNEKPIIIIGATNHPESIDDAVLRAGRFDRIVKVSMPDSKSREEILTVHLKKIQHDQSINISKIAKDAINFSGADLANLVNESAIIAINKHKEVVNMSDFEEAINKIKFGTKNTTMKQSPGEKENTAYHEAGHALILLLSQNSTYKLENITINPQGDSLGSTQFLPQEDKHGYSKEELLTNIAIALGGRAAEELIFNKLTTGAFNDFEHASNIARSMICHYGMFDNILGKQVLIKPLESYSQEIQKNVDVGVSQILEDQYKIVTTLLKTNIDKLHKLAKALLKNKTLSSDEVCKLLGIKN